MGGGHKTREPSQHIAHFANIIIMFARSKFPSIHFHLCVCGQVVVATGYAGYSRCPSTATLSSSCWRSQRPDERFNPFSKFGSTLAFPPQLDEAQNPPKKGTKETSESDAQTTSTGFSPDVRLSQFVLKSLATLWRK